MLRLPMELLGKSLKEVLNMHVYADNAATTKMSQVAITAILCLPCARFWKMVHGEISRKRFMYWMQTERKYGKRMGSINVPRRI